MSYLETIVDYINETLENSVLSDKRFQNKMLVGIAQSMPRTEKKNIQLIPSYVDNQGEGQYVGPDDDFDLIIYHRVNGILAGKANVKTGYGDSKGFDANVARMSLVAFGRRDRLCMTNDEVAMYLQSNMPEAATPTMLSALQFKAANINTTDIVLNDMQVFNEEYQNIKYFLKPEQFLLKINYNIESAYLKGCFNTCD